MTSKNIIKTQEVVAKVEPYGVQVTPAVGRPGPAATIEVGFTYTGLPGTGADVDNRGTPYAAVLDFTIPRGDVGPPGEKGDPGEVAGNLDGGFF